MCTVTGFRGLPKVLEMAPLEEEPPHGHRHSPRNRLRSAAEGRRRAAPGALVRLHGGNQLGEDESAEVAHPHPESTPDQALHQRLAHHLGDDPPQRRRWIRGGLDGHRGARAVLRVVNRGPVVPEAEIDRLFQPFQRMAPERTRRGDRGTGLGLSIVQAIADAHGAAIASRPHPDGGLEVEVTFPLPAAQL